MSFAQKAVTGTVKDKSGEPLIGVSVMIDGTSQGTVTDFDGNFRVPNVSANTVLNVSYIGYKAQKVKVGNQDNITITLEDDNQQLQEVVVVGYGTMKK